MKSIQEIKQEIKNGVGDGVAEWGVLIIVFLVGIGSFGLGRLSALQGGQTALSIFQAPKEYNPRPIVLGGLILASKTGKAYYYPWCTGATKISIQNQIWFSNESEARKAGYTPAKGCQGLK